MAQDFYPFVDNAQAPVALDIAGAVRHPARIAVYDDAAAAPRVVVVEPKDVRSYLEEITLQVTQLAQGQGGMIPFMVIREIVENFIHAYFIEPTISILDHGNTIRFSDQGPGIREKERALQYGTTSATEEMRHYIRGVGSGLPYAQQYMIDKGGSLAIDDNIQGGTVVTISTRPQDAHQAQPNVPQMQPQAAQTAQSPFWPQAPTNTGQWVQQPQTFGWQAPTYPQQQGWGYAAPVSGQPQWAGYQAPQPGYYPTPQSNPWPQQATPQQVAAPEPEPAVEKQPSWVDLTVRGRAILDYLSSHESVGPSDLARTYGESQPTWTRELQALEEQGVLRKEGQKRRLTAAGRSLL